MRGSLRLAGACAAIALALTAPAAQAHHSLSGQFDTTKSFEINGVVSRVDWVNPHTYVYVDVKQANGSLLTYKLESLPVAMMRKAGLSKQELLGDGKAVHVTAHPARNGTVTLGYMLFLKLADGREIQFSRVPGAEDPAAGAK
jgi:Family of unknown function (DUF6152)